MERALPSRRARFYVSASNALPLAPKQNTGSWLLSMRIGISVLAIAACILLILAAARIGFSRLLSKYALVADSMPAADEAVKLAPSDPDAHRARAGVLNHLRLPAEGKKELEIAASLRSRDDYLWLELGNARDQLEDSEGALAAVNQAVRWAPYYAHPRWQRGNLLLRMGRYEEAFADLRAAAASNGNFVPNLIDVAWGLVDGDAKRTEELVQINDDKARLAFVRFLSRKGKGPDVVDQVRLLKVPLSEQNRRDLIRQLLGSKLYRAAFDLGNRREEPAISDGGFEKPLGFDKADLGWVVSREDSKISLALDVSEPLTGTKSLQIRFAGASNPNLSVLSQTIIVKPQKRYRIRFAVRTKDLVTGGLPLISVSDALSNELLASSDNFPSSTNSWRPMEIEFSSLPTSEAIAVELRRNNCSSSPCPIFGTLWLDEFSIEEANSKASKP